MIYCTYISTYYIFKNRHNKQKHYIYTYFSIVPLLGEILPLEAALPQWLFYFEGCFDLESGFTLRVVLP